MEEILKELNKINKLKVNQAFYRVSPHIRSLDIKLYRKKYKDNMKMSTVLKVDFAEDFETPSKITINETSGSFTSTTISYNKLIKILESYEG